MKWSVLGLVVVGLAAAVCAAVLMTSMRAGGLFAAKESEPAEVEIVVAAGDLPAMTIVDGSLLATTTVSKAEAPEGYFGSMVQVIGKVLTVPLVKGQVLERKHFAAEGSGAHLASALKEGMRAVSVSLTDYSGLYGLLYPGSVVDVLAYMKLPNESGRQGDAVSVTLLRKIQVLGVEDQTVVSMEKDEDPKGLEGKRAPNKRWMVTVMVDARQAQALQLAMENGRISLALRNPMDESGPEDDGRTSLRELTTSAPSRGDSEPSRFGPIGFLKNAMSVYNPFGSGTTGDRSEAHLKQCYGGQPVAANAAGSGTDVASATGARGLWVMEILRAGDSQKVAFPLTYSSPEPTQTP
jgi:pilus assembly protein CpaB